MAWITWDPSRFVFTIPYFDHPIAWYGCCFAFGFILGFFIIRSLLEKKLQITRSPQEAKTLSLFLADRLVWYTVAGSLIGARLGHVFFYDWPIYRANPIEIFKVWEGGLASHGGTLGVILALYFYRRAIHFKVPELSFLSILDLVCIPAALAGVWIRIGNFFNQEIVGKETSLPWAIIFSHPMETQGGVPRHPAQLYEAIAYLMIFIFLFFFWKRYSEKLKPGFLFGLFLVLLFGARFLLEEVKLPQSQTIDESYLLAGQLLSLPFILVGCGLMALKKNRVYSR